MIKLIRHPQPGLVECGPAAICAVISSNPKLSSKFTISTVIQAAGAEETIQTNGTNLAQLAQAVSTLSKDSMMLVFKSHGTLDEIHTLLKKDIPVIVDWQGSTFEADDGGRGHYSVVIDIAKDTQTFTLIDSLPDFPELRLVSTPDFLEKWHDFDEIIDKTGKEIVKQNHQVMAIIIPQTSASPYLRDLQFIPGEAYFQSVT